MKVVYVIHTSKNPLTAVYKHVLTRSRYLTEEGHSVEILCPSDIWGERKVTARRIMLLFPFFIFILIVRQRPRPDIIIFHSYSGWFFNLYRFLFRYECISVTQFHGLEPIAYKAAKIASGQKEMPLSLRYRCFHGFIMPKLLRITSRLSNKIFCLNDSEREYLIERRWAAPANITVIPNEVSEDFFLQRKYRADVSRLIFLGQWLPNKGIQELCAAFSMLTIERPGLRLTCIGTLAKLDEVIRCFPQHCRHLVEVYPRVSKEEIRSALSEADIFVFPTISEGFSLALIEAMATGLPIVTTEVGAAPDFLVDGESVIFVNCRDEGGIVRAVQCLIGDYNLREKLGKNAQATAFQFRASKVLEDYRKLLHNLSSQDQETSKSRE